SGGASAGAGGAAAPRAGGTAPRAAAAPSAGAAVVATPPAAPPGPRPFRHTPDEAGLPSAVRGVGAVAGVGVPAGNCGHWAANSTGSAAAMPAPTASPFSHLFIVSSRCRRCSPFLSHWWHARRDSLAHGNAKG